MPTAKICVSLTVQELKTLQMDHILEVTVKELNVTVEGKGRMDFPVTKLETQYQPNKRKAMIRITDGKGE